jgi:hypothetical protein
MTEIESKLAMFGIPKEESNAVIRHNIISHNGLSGISLDGGIYDLYLAHIAAYPNSPLFTSPNMLKSSICLQPIGFIQPTKKSVQVIGLETGVHINTGRGLLISPISVDNFEFEFILRRYSCRR